MNDDYTSDAIKMDEDACVPQSISQQRYFNPFMKNVGLDPRKIAVGVCEREAQIRLQFIDQRIYNCISSSFISILPMGKCETSLLTPKPSLFYLI